METITIRTAKKSDAAELLRIYAPYVKETAITFEYDVPSEQEFAERIAKTMEKYPYLAAEIDGTLVGYAYAGAFHARAAYDWAVETSIYVDRNRKRQGIGEHLYQALEDRLKAMGIVNLNACIAYPREKDPYLTADSVRFHETLGYRLVGRFDSCGYKFDRWYDMVWMEKHIGRHTRPQPPVRWFPALEGEYGTQK